MGNSHIFKPLIVFNKNMSNIFIAAREIILVFFQGIITVTSLYLLSKRTHIQVQQPISG